MSFLAIITTFVLIFPIELPDKTFIATLVLATRFPPMMVWLGVSLAFGVQSLVAVVAGRLLILMPEYIVTVISTVGFLLGGFLLFRGASHEPEKEEREEHEFEAKIKKSATGLKAAGISFAIIFAAEWGDLSQLLAVGLVAQGRPPLSVFIGSWAALIAVAGLGVIVGKRLQHKISVVLLRRIGGTLCFALALWEIIHLLSS